MSVVGAHSTPARRLISWRNLDREDAELQSAEFAFGESSQIRGEILSARENYYLEYRAHWKSDLGKLELKLRILREDGASTLGVTKRKRVVTIERDGEPVKLEPELEIVDIEATPSTNTIPIRWLLSSGLNEKTFVALLVHLPSLECTLTRQHYRVLDYGRFEYEAPDSGFNASLVTDPDGVVLEYGKIWKGFTLHMYK